MSDYKLRLCPYCGGEADFEKCSGMVDEIRWSVGCSTDGCQGYQSLVTFQRRADAAKAWNRRVDLSESSRWLEDLLAIYDTVAAAAWLTSPHKFLNGAIPLDLVRQGKQSEVAKIVDQLTSGAYS